MLKYRNGLKDIPVYNTREQDWDIKVNANECNMNLPPVVEERLMGRLSCLAYNRYPTEEYDALCDQIARNHRIRKENILLGNGSSEIIEKLFYCFGGNKLRKIVYPAPSFSMYPIYAQAAQATGIPFQLNDDYSMDVEAFTETVNGQKAGLAVICNPNNPTGNGFSVSDIEYIADHIHPNCALLIDEAYMEFFGHTAAALLHDHPNLIIARTFSKAYALASARVGYMLADERIVSMIEKAFMPYHMNSLSLAAADIVYQMRHEYVPRIQMIVAERKRMSTMLDKLPGVIVYPSETNFLLICYSKAALLTEYLASKKIGVRCFGKDSGLRDCIRISIGLREENDIWYDAVKAFVEERA